MCKDGHYLDALFACPHCTDTACEVCAADVCSVCTSGYFLDAGVCGDCTAVTCPAGQYQATCGGQTDGCTTCSVTNCANCPGDVCAGTCLVGTWDNGACV